jgi:hypothetical protein
MVNATTGVITTVAGNGTAYSGSQQDYCTGGTGDGGVASAAKFNSLTGIAFDPANNIYLTDSGSCTVRRNDAGTGTINTIAGKGSYYAYLGNQGDLGAPGDNAGSAYSAATPLATAVSHTIAVNKATPTVTLQASATSISTGTSVTFTATIAGPGAAAPSGSVTFLDGTTTLGTGTLTGGAATYSTTKLAAGKHSVTAKYAGDANYVTTTSSAVAVTVATAKPE